MPTDGELRAYHEAGHAIVAHQLERTVNWVNIIRADIAGGPNDDDVEGIALFMAGGAVQTLINENYNDQDNITNCFLNHCQLPDDWVDHIDRICPQGTLDRNGIHHIIQARQWGEQIAILEASVILNNALNNQNCQNAIDVLARRIHQSNLVPIPNRAILEIYENITG